MNVSWYCARTAGRETRAVLYLTRAGYEPFRPVIHRYFIDKRRKIERYRELSLFPGYVFFAATDAAHAAQARSAIGVADVLGEWRGAAYVPREIPARYIGKLIDECPVIEGRRRKFCSGERVAIVVAGIRQIIAEVDEHSGSKVRVYANVLGKQTVVTVDENLVEAAG